MGRLPGLPAAVAIAATIVPAPFVRAQESGGLTAQTALSFGVEYEDEEWNALAGVGFTLNSTTRSRSVSLSLNTSVESQDDGLDLVDPDLQFTYATTGPSSALEAALRLRQFDLGDVVIEDTETDTAGDISTVSGTRDEAQFDTTLSFGLNAPVGGELDLGLRQVSYTDAGTLDDFQTERLAATLRWSVTPSVDLRTTARYLNTESDGDGTDRTDQAFGLGADLTISRSVTTSIDLNFSDIETEDAGGIEEISGLTYNLRTTQITPTGQNVLEIGSRLTEDGDRIDATIGQTRELSVGALSWSAGLSRAGDGEVDAIFAVDYGRALPRSEVSVSLARQVRTDPFGDELLSNEVGADIQYAFSEIASLGGGLVYRDTEFLDGTSDDIQRLELNLGYRYSITRDVALITEFTHSRSQTGSDDAETDNRIYLGAERVFNWRP